MEEDDISHLMSGNKGVGYSLKTEGVIEDDWSDEFDDKDPEYWENYQGWEDDSTIEARQEAYLDQNLDIEESRVENLTRNKPINQEGAKNSLENFISSEDNEKARSENKTSVDLSKLESDLKVGNCVLSYRCSMMIEDMYETQDDNVKFCPNCKQEVYICNTIYELGHAMVLNRCVAFSSKRLLKQNYSLKGDDFDLGIPF